MFALGRRLPCRAFNTTHLRGFCASASTDSATSGGGKQRTFYDILEISRKARQDDVKDAYRKLAKKYHPDRNSDDPKAEAKFKEVQEANSTLSDPWKRALYDQDLQFSNFGSAATQTVDKEQWTEHWDKETPEEREARKERYQRYAAGERIDLPPAQFPVRWTPVFLFGAISGVFYVCVRAPDWFDLQSEATHCDRAFDDRSVPLVRAFHDPILNRWERLPEGVEPPKPAEIYAHYRKVKPMLMEDLDLSGNARLLPRISLTVMHVPRTDAVKAGFRPQAQSS